MEITTHPPNQCQQISAVASNRPSILEVIGAHVDLRRAGAEYVGLCPFHWEKTASFHVSESKGLFYCFGCAAGGDVISFVEQIDGIDFKQAVKRLGVETFRPSPERVRVRNEAGRIVAWARGVSVRLRGALREVSDEIRVVKLAREQPEADRALLAEHEASLIRRWAILCDFDDDVNNPKFVIEMWARREDIENFLESVE